jgi:hypothetical protein
MQYETYRPRGIIKRTWCEKHRMRVPSLAVAIFEYECVYGDLLILLFSSFCRVTCQVGRIARLAFTRELHHVVV